MGIASSVKVPRNTPPEMDTLSFSSMAWQELAACRSADTELFFPIGKGMRAKQQADAAKAICASCVVRHECLRYAMQSSVECGVFGGYSEDERRDLRRKTITT